MYALAIRVGNRPGQALIGLSLAYEKFAGLWPFIGLTDLKAYFSVRLVYHYYKALKAYFTIKL
ncbi:hypothetical protein MTR_5g075920 [Medicago truncatula]|uniref:Uncharacterized protein n=1 Tax=Medicago truncatula TaxID=3880 RepID=G7K5V7_MEDTR|nr:hypothetical protein MTR_5g075920 [Medicago truncatula]